MKENSNNFRMHVQDIESLGRKYIKENNVYNLGKKIIKLA